MERWKRYLQQRHATYVGEGQDIGRETWLAQGGEEPAVSDAPELDATWDIYYQRAIDAGILGLLNNTERVGEGVVVAGLAGLREALNRLLRIGHDYSMSGVNFGIGQVGDALLWQRIATLDNRTCMACVMLHGAMYRSPGEFMDHPYGRCILIPVRNETRPIVPEGAGEEWFMGLSDEEKRALMGPEYYAAWLAGKYRLSDLLKWMAAGYVIVRALHELTEEEE